MRILLVVVAVLVAPVAAGAQTPTFSKDVAPILYSKCVECHRPSMFAPMSLVKYEDARPWARSIRNRVAARTMPPWGADPAHGTFKNDPRLSDKEIATILAWVDGGAPKGDNKDLPKLPEFAEGWSIGKPDVVFTMEQPFEIPATGTVEYQYIRIPTGIKEDKWMAAIEIKPEARAQVHRRRCARSRQYRWRDAEQARRHLRPRRGADAGRQFGHRPPDALHDQRQGDD
jgi:mono/diheme cytochrome c family protein